MANLVIFGATSFAKMAHHYFTRDTEHRVCGFVVDAGFREGDEYLGLPLVDSEAVRERFGAEEYKMFVAVGYTGMNSARSNTCERMRGMGYELATYISTKASYLSDRLPGENAFVLEGVIVQPFARVGKDVVIWSGAIVAHDSSVGDHCFLGPGAVVCGDCRIGHHSFLGANCTIRNGVTIAERTLVGAGVTVLRDTKAGDVLASVFPRVGADSSNGTAI